MEPLPKSSYLQLAPLTISLALDAIWTAVSAGVLPRVTGTLIKCSVFIYARINHKNIMFLNDIFSSASKSIFQSYLNSIHRSGLGSLRRGIGRTNGPEPMGVLRKTKAAMIWKKGWKGWKKLHSFGSNNNSSNSSNKIVGEFDKSLIILISFNER